MHLAGFFISKSVKDVAYRVISKAFLIGMESSNDESVIQYLVKGCVVFGSYYKKITDVEIKRNYGSGLGILVTCLICGLKVLYTIFLVWSNVIILKCCDRRYVHQVSLLFTWTFLLYMHFNVDCSKYFCWILQTVSLRLVGLAFELSAPEKPKTDMKSSTVLKINDKEDNETKLTKINAAEVISYAFYFIGIHRGPYYRWKTFNDHFHASFSGLGDCRLITEQKVKKALVCALGYSLLHIKYSEKAYSDNDFYRNSSTDYRFVFNFPLLMKYFFEHQITMMLCTAVCTETGFGVYPAKCEPTPGHGPTAEFSLLRLASGDTDVALQQEYNFSMLKCFDNQKLLVGPKLRDTMRGWDMSVRYWFWANIYTDFVKSNKEVRSACSFLAWTIWRGPSKQQTILSLTLWAYIHLESDYSTLYNTTGSMKRAWDFGFSIMRILCLVYITPCLVINDSATVMRYYNSIYWVFHIVLIILTLAALFMYKTNYLVTNVPKPLPPAPKASGILIAKLRRESVAPAHAATSTMRMDPTGQAPAAPRPSRSHEDPPTTSRTNTADRK